MKSCLKRRLQTGTALICSLAMAFSVLPVSAEESTQSLESKTSDLAGQLAGINQELVAISDQISTTEMQVEITNGEIQRTKDSLADTQAKEAQQYNDMKTRIKYMYETGSASLLEMLFSAEDMTDFLNKADFIQNISDYDRKMLTELQETKNQIAEEEKTLPASRDAAWHRQSNRSPYPNPADGPPCGVLHGPQDVPCVPAYSCAPSGTRSSSPLCGYRYVKCNQEFRSNDRFQPPRESLA